MIQGIYASHQGIVGERRGDFASAILRIDPTGMAPLLAISSGMPNEACTDTVFTWFEDYHISGRTACVSGGTTTTVVVADGSFYTRGTILWVEQTGEHLLVNSTNGNSLTVTRGMSGTTIVSITSAMFVQKIGSAFEEASYMPIAIAQQGHPRINYTQIFRNTWAVTGTATAVQYHTGGKVARNKRDCAMYHAEDQERSFIWGRKHIGVLNNNQFRITDGLNQQIANGGGLIENANTGAVAGALSLADLNEFLRKVFAKNVKGMPNERIAFCGDIVLSQIQRMVLLDSTYNISQGETKHGIMVTTVVSPFGQLKLMTHPLMNQNPVWQKELYVYHPGAIKRRTLRPTFENNYDSGGNQVGASGPGFDAVQGVITTEGGIECGAGAVMGILRNITTGVKTV